MALQKGRTIRVLAVCGAGMGTSAFIKAKCANALRKFNVDAIVDVEVAANINKHVGSRCDVIFTSKNIAEGKLKPIVDENIVPVIVMLNIMSSPEYEDKVEHQLLPLFED
ncbi:MAG: PTS sugar transporter subunit IIB [Erysipelotrichaceae bacterium]|nr:PTS sugar transporter subunit IIB [Erysipelotrichaceae bacterium]